jgi:hypothetical protein
LNNKLGRTGGGLKEVSNWIENQRGEPILNISPEVSDGGYITF